MNVARHRGHVLWALVRTVPVTRPLSVITAAPGGAVRAGGITTITTATPHGFVQGDLVAISGVSDSSFDGVFTVASVPTTTTLTFEQSGQPDSTSGGGTVSSPTASSIASSGAVRASG